MMKGDVLDPVKYIDLPPMYHMWRVNEAKFESFGIPTIPQARGGDAASHAQSVATTKDKL